MADTPIVQYPDASGNRAYAKTHVQAIDGLDDKLSDFLKKSDLQNITNQLAVLTSPDGTRWSLSVDNDGRLSTSKIQN